MAEEMNSRSSNGSLASPAEADLDSAGRSMELPVPLWQPGAFSTPRMGGVDFGLPSYAGRGAPFMSRNELGHPLMVDTIYNPSNLSSQSTQSRDVRDGQFHNSDSQSTQCRDGRDDPGSQSTQGRDLGDAEQSNLLASKLPESGDSQTNLFDPRTSSSASKYTFKAPKSVSEYLETHFRRTLVEEERRSMLSTHPRADTDVLKLPKVDAAVLSWLGTKYPKSVDGRFSLVQKAVHAATGPLTCLWSAMVEDGSELPDSIPTEEVLEVIQRSLVLLGNVNALLLQARRQTILEAGEKELAKLTKDDIPSAGQELFGGDFTDNLTAKAKANTAIQEATKMVRPFRAAGSGPNRTRTPYSHRFAGRDSTRFQSRFNKYSQSTWQRGHHASSSQRGRFQWHKKDRNMGNRNATESTGTGRQG